MRRFIAVMLAGFIAAGLASARECSVKGRVVDDSGNPVSKAQIYYGGAYVDDVDEIIVINEPDDSGFFKLTRRCAETFFDLLITSKVDYKNSILPIDPQIFSGIKLKKNNADVGDIKIHTVFQKVKITFQTETGANLFANLEDARKYRFSIKNEKGKYAADFHIFKEEAFDNSAVWFTLSEGKWAITGKPETGKGKTIYAEKLIEISRTPPNIPEINVKMTEQKIRY